MKHRHLFRFETEGAIQHAVEILLKYDQTDFETYSPYPLRRSSPDPILIPETRITIDKTELTKRPDLARIELRPQNLSVAALLGGITGGCLGYWLQYFSEVQEFPRMIADRPQHSWPAFLLVTFELTILGAAVSIFYAFFVTTRLPQWNHPVFEVPGFDRASQDQFFLELIRDEHDLSPHAWIHELQASEVSHAPLA